LCKGLALAMGRLRLFTLIMRNPYSECPHPVSKWESRMTRATQLGSRREGRPTYHPMRCGGSSLSRA
jgi:hypothetical protein